jgi:hypothetical protein
MPDQEGPALVPGETWRPRGQGMAREIVGRATNEDGTTMIRFLTRHGEFVTSEQDFRFWIERLSASVI